MTNYEPYVSPAAELYHSRTKGSRNGERRYQNLDGTGTALGLRRRREQYRAQKGYTELYTDRTKVGPKQYKGPDYHDEKGNVRSIGDIRKAQEEEYYKELNLENARRGSVRKSLDADQKEAKDVGDSLLTIGKEGLNIGNTLRNKRLERQREEIMRNMDLSEMTNKDLQDYITRKNLERQYKNLAVDEMEIGETFVDRVLDKAGTAVTVGGSAIGIALAMRKLIYG